MALIEKMAYQQSADLLSVDLYDTTLIYNATTNPNGYGVTSFSPNALPSDILDFRGYIYFPDSTTLLPDTTPFDISNITADYAVIIYPTLPNLTGVPYTYDSTAVFGSSQAWATGWYRFHTWAIDSGDTVYETDYLIPIFGSLDCCINNLIANAKLCGCNKKNYTNLLIARAGLDQLYVADRTTGTISNIETCQLYNKGAEIMINATAVCQNDGCEPCSDC